MAALNKIAATSPSRQHPNETETNIANALHDLETNIPDMKSYLRPLQFVSAREVSSMTLPIPSGAYRLALKNPLECEMGHQEDETNLGEHDHIQENLD